VIERALARCLPDTDCALRSIPFASGRWTGALTSAVAVSVSVALLVLGPVCGAAAAPPVRRSAALSQPDRAGVRGFQIYLAQRDEPIVVSRYTVEDGQVVFEKYGGEIRIPEAQVSRIVPDLPEDEGDATGSVASNTATASPGPLYLAMRGGSNFKVTELTPGGDHVRVTAVDGTFTVLRTDILGYVRMPLGSGVPEAWLSTETTGVPARPTPVVPVTGDTAIPYPTSDRPHRLHLADGLVMDVEGFWVEDGVIRFRRFGGIVGVPRDTVVGLFLKQTVPLEERIAARFLSQPGPNLLEVQARGESHYVWLAGVEPVDESAAPDDLGSQIQQGTALYLEFDTQPSDAAGRWLAYVFLPNGRMLNAELVRLGLARPRLINRKGRYADLFEKLASRPFTKR
jgi:Staphylococcal nuclease homologue